MPGLNAVNCCNITFIMIDTCSELQAVFETIADKPEFSGKLYSLSALERQQVKSVKVFLQLAFSLTTKASGSNYATLGMQPMIFGILECHCNHTTSGDLVIGITTSLEKKAAHAMRIQLKKYKNSMKSPVAKLDAVFDPEISYVEKHIAVLRCLVREQLTVGYGYRNGSDAYAAHSHPGQLTLLDKSRRKRVSSSDVGQRRIPIPCSRQGRPLF